MNSIKLFHSASAFHVEFDAALANFRLLQREEQSKNKYRLPVSRQNRNDRSKKNYEKK